MFYKRKNEKTVSLFKYLLHETNDVLGKHCLMSLKKALFASRDPGSWLLKNAFLVLISKRKCG